MPAPWPTHGQDPWDDDLKAYIDLNTPQARKLAGLDLSADRTAAAIKAALAIVTGDVTGLATALSGKAPVPTGTPDGTRFFADDNTWRVPPGASAVPLNPDTAGYHFGDSFTVGVGASDSAHQYTTILDLACGLSAVTNRAHSGDQAWDQGLVAMTFPINDSMTNTLLIGTNDLRTYNTDANKLAEWKTAFRFLLWWLTTPESAKVYPSGVTTTGTWDSPGAGNLLLPAGQQAIRCQGNGTATFTVEGDTAYLATVSQQTDTSTYSITVDGVSQGTFNVAPAATMTTVNGATFGPRLHRFTGLGPGPHTVVLTATAAGGNPAVYFVAASGSRGIRTSTSPRLAVGVPSRFTAGGYSASGGSDSSFILYHNAIRQLVREAQDAGLNVSFADTALDRSSQLGGDGVHPNDSGHARIAAAFVESLQQKAYLRDHRAGLGGSVPMPVSSDASGTVPIKQSDGSIAYGLPSTAVFAGAAVKRTTAYTVPNSGLTAIPWDAADYDTNAFWSSGSPTRLTVPAGQGGKYLITANWQPSTSTHTGRVIGAIAINGATNNAFRNSEATGVSGSFIGGGVSFVKTLAAGDYLEFCTFIGTGTAGLQLSSSGFEISKIS